MARSFSRVGLHFFGGMQIGFRDDLHQRHAAAIEIDQRHVALMDVLAGIFFQVHAPDADLALALRRFDLQPAVAAQRIFVLRDLITFGQVGIEIVLAREDVELFDGAVQRQPGHDRHLDRAAIDHRQHARHARADGAHVRVGRLAVRHDDRAPAEHLRFGNKFGVNFQPDNAFVVHSLYPCRRTKRSMRRSASSIFS